MHLKSTFEEEPLHGMDSECLGWLYALEGIDQDPFYHPEGDALYHSLQVFEIAIEESDDPELWAVALFHDIGKAIDKKHHARLGAQMLEGVCAPRVVWLVRHHMDLLTHPKKTRRLLHQTPQLRELEQIRRWDLAGRSPDAYVMEPEDAIERLIEHNIILTLCGLSAMN